MKTNSNNSNSAQRVLSAVQSANKQNRAAKEAVKQASHNILYYVRALNALANRNEYCDSVSVLDLGVSVQRLLSPNVRAKMLPGQLFHASLFTKDYQSRACVVKSYGGTITLAQVQAEHGAVITDNGREIVISADGTGLVMLQPVTLTLSGVCSAFCYINTRAARVADAEARAQRRAEREQKRVEREREKRLRELRKRFIAGEINARQYRCEALLIEQAA